jgi:hypothetical protein
VSSSVGICDTPAERLTCITLLSRVSDPLVHHGRHFGRSIHALSRVHSLLTNGLIRDTDLDGCSEENLSAE